MRMPCNITLVSGTKNRKERFQRETGIKVSALSVSKAFMKSFRVFRFLKKLSFSSLGLYFLEHQTVL